MKHKETLYFAILKKKNMKIAKKVQKFEVGAELCFAS